MVIEDDMDCLEVYVGTTTMTMNERFSMLAATSPFLGAAPRRARRRSTNDGPLLNSNFRNQNIVDEVVHHLGLDWRVQELQQNNYSRPGSRAGGWTGSRKGSRAGSMVRYGSEASLSGLGFNNWDKRSRAGSVGNLSQQSGRSRRSSGDFSDGSRTVRFNRQPALNMHMRLQMRDAWLRGRRARGRGARGQGGGQNRGIYRRNWQNQRRGRGRGYRRGRGRQTNQGSQGSASGQGAVTRSRSRLNGANGWNNDLRDERGRGRGRGRGGGRGGTHRGGISLSSMPQLKTLAQLDKELEEYMASTPASLDKQLDDYMAQNGMDFDL